MSHLFLISLGLLLVQPAVAQNNLLTDITVEITGIDTHRGGNLMVLVFADDGFPKNHGKALHGKIVAANNSHTVIQLKVQSDDKLAFKVLHDEDLNNRVTKNWTGIWPSEGLGFSNGTRMGVFGPPNFSEAKLSREEYRKAVAIHIHYPGTED